MQTRRNFIAALGAGVVVAAAPARAAEPVVEILAMQHWPVRKALEPVMAVLARYQGRVRVVLMDVESEEGEKRLRAIGLKGHIPIVLMINGARAFRRADGSTSEFLNFPGGAANPMGLNGAWRVEDFEGALKSALGETPGTK